MHDPQLQERPDAEVVDLDEWLDRVDSEGIDYDAPVTPPETHQQANAWLSILARIDRQQRSDEDTVRAEKQKLDNWLAERSESRAKRIKWLEMSLEGFMRVAALRDKVRSVELPAGKLKLRSAKASTKIVVTDPVAFRTWATSTEHAEMLRPPKDPEPDKVTIKKVAEQGSFTPSPLDVSTDVAPLVIDGEIIPGVQAERPAADVFSIER